MPRERGRRMKLVLTLVARVVVKFHRSAPQAGCWLYGSAHLLLEFRRRHLARRGLQKLFKKRLPSSRPTLDHASTTHGFRPRVRLTRSRRPRQILGRQIRFFDGARDAPSSLRLCVGARAGVWSSRTARKSVRSVAAVAKVAQLRRSFFSRTTVTCFERMNWN